MTPPTRHAAPLLILAIFCILTRGAFAQPTRLIDLDGSRATAVHRIPLYHAEGEKINLDDDPLLPFSTRVTCGQCHDYKKIKTGWHFNADDPDISPGRPGEPWILVHRTTGTQLPLSCRKWPGTYTPSQAGLTPWLFTRAFGSHLPGGGMSEPRGTSSDPGARWWVSGKLEINCLHCHNADPAQNGSEWAVQVSRQNFLWAAAAASSLAVVTGSAAKVSDSFDPFMESSAGTRGPRTRYPEDRFNARGEVFFNVVRRPDPGRCYFCHSTREVGPTAPEKWNTDPDVHLTKGLLCTDCHRNGLDHKIVRGHEGEAAETGNPPAATLTCRGCHKKGGRLGAPVPDHADLPPDHLETLTCTACHSGPQPGSLVPRTQTSLSHRMGVHGGYRGEDAPPYLFSPVFLRLPDGRIAPHKMMWPSFWGVLSKDIVTVTSHFEVLEAAGKILDANRERSKPEKNESPPLTRETVIAVLDKMTARDPDKGIPVFISGGRLYRQTENGLSGIEHPSAAPYAWPLAHDVRPASQALGSSGCTDCHAPDSPFHFGRIRAETPGAIETPAGIFMHEFQDLDPVFLQTLAASVRARPVFKWIGFTASGVIALVLILYTFHGLGRILQRRRKPRQTRTR